MAKHLRLIALLLWVISLFLPGIMYTNGQAAFGYGILMIGWLGLLAGNVAWYANIFALISFFHTKRHKTGLVLSLIAIAVGLQAFQIHEIPQNEGGNNFIVNYLGVGYYLWLASFLLLAVYHFLNKSKIQSIAAAK